LELPGGSFTAGSAGFTYDIVQPGETAHLTFRVLNTGPSPWSGPEFRFSPIPGSEYESLPSLPLPEDVPPGETVIFEIDLPDVAATSLETVEYSMTYQGQPFEAVVKGYVFILPEPIKDIEDELRKTIEEWAARGEQELQDLVDRILQDIQEAVEREAEKSLERTLRQCLQTNAALALGALALYWRRRSRESL
jgi:hypothetical protein